MKDAWTIGKKLITSFLGVAFITLVVGLAGFYGANLGAKAIYELSVVRLPSVDSLLIVKNSMDAVRGSIRTLTIPGLDMELRQRQYTNLDNARVIADKAIKTYEPLPQTAEEARLWQQFVPALTSLRQENNKVVELSRKLDANGIANPMDFSRRMEQFTKDHYRIVNQIRNLLENPETSFDGGDSHTTCNAGRFFASFETQNQRLLTSIRNFDAPHRRFHDTAGRIKKLVAEGQTDAAHQLFRSEMQPAMTAVFASFGEMEDLANESMEMLQTMRTQALGIATVKQREAISLLDQVVEINRNLAASESENAQKQATFIKFLVLIFSVAGVLLAIGLGLLITRGINTALSRIIAGLYDGADQVASASGQVSSASVSLAEGASEQAASIEETSSSLEEMSSMIKQNADNAGEANALMGQTRQVVETANKSMQDLTHSMGEISKASQETSKIIKTIDEIAFQTNLLALNAAVEAARAGEAGAGFAVVADEVRNLAMRAAEAARNTASLIEGTVKKVEEGSTLVTRTNQAFGEVASRNTQVGQLVAEIAAASREQSQGIEQINKATTEMDKVIQQNAANAEESASASEEMNAQAEQMKSMVQELVAMVGGAVSKRRSSGGDSFSSHDYMELERPKKLQTGRKPLPATGKAGLQRPPKAPGREINPRQVIPMDDDDFSNF